MMPKRKVLSWKSHPTSLPIWSTATAFLLLREFHVPGWLKGVVWTIFVIFWVLAIVGIVTEEKIDIEDIGKR